MLKFFFIVDFTRPYFSSGSTHISTYIMAVAAFLAFLKDQFFETPPYPTQDFTGQTVIVTGSNVGLGLEAARHFTRLNAAKVILGVRDTAKGDKAKRAIEESTNRLNVVEVWQLDLSSYESVEKFATRAHGLDRLDVVVENAGISTGNFKLVEDNETTITVNVVSTFLLALLVLPKLQETATRHHVQPHLVIVSSEVHGFTSMPERKSVNIFESLNEKEIARMDDRYDDARTACQFNACNHDHLGITCRSSSRSFTAGSSPNIAGRAGSRSWSSTI